MTMTATHDTTSLLSVNVSDPIIVWSKPQCVQCSATCRKLDQLGLPYVVRNLADHPEKVTEFKSQHITQAPVVVPPGADMFHGYRPDLLERLAATHRTVS